ncbi:MAG: COX15/CtaA family protein [Pseudomonas sp.]
MTVHKTLPGYRLALFATLLAVVVVLLGAYTRLTHAGLGCPDWPGCYGFIGVPQGETQLAHAEANFPHAPVEAQKGWNEMIHRYFAGSLGLLILGLAIQAVRRRAEPGQPLKLPLLLLGVVIAQAAFGMWTVTLQLWPQVVTAHLLGGFTTLSLLFLLSLRLSGRLPVLPTLSRRLRLLAGVALALVIGQIALGGWVSSNYAAVACVDLPTCHGQWWPDVDFANGFHLTQHIGPNYLGGQLDSDARTAIHLTHRVGALLVTLVLLVLAWRLRAAAQGRLAGLLLLALALQVSLGISNVLLHLPLAVAVAHNAGGAGLLLVLVLVNYRLRGAARASSPARSPVPVELATTGLGR